MSPGNSSQKISVKLQNEDGADEDLEPGYMKGHGDYGDDGSDDDSLDHDWYAEQCPGMIIVEMYGFRFAIWFPQLVHRLIDSFWESVCHE